MFCPIDSYGIMRLDDVAVPEMSKEPNLSSVPGIIPSVSKGEGEGKGV